jgi:uncharacterized membrane protein YfcA
MSSWMILFLFLIIIFFSTLLRSAFGFGNALIAMPLLILLTDINTATPTVALIGLVIAGLMLLREWRYFQIKDTLYLLGSSLVGIPVGLYFLISLPENIVQWLLGLVLIGYGLINLSGIKMPRIENNWLTIPFGFLAGILGGAYNANGPPIIIFALLRGWTKEKFRATLQGYFLITGLFISAGHGLSQLWTRQVLTYFVLSVPVVVLAVFVGGRLTAKTSTAQFERALNIFLIFLGILMFI